MIYYIEPKDLAPERLVQVLRDNSNILFVSLVTVDLGNNHTDERIPVQDFIHNLDDYLKKGIQTDGSSVVLPKIADINDAKVDIIPDPTVRWFVDYSYTHLTEEARLPVGTLIIPCFLYHRGKPVGSRSVLKRANEVLDYELKLLLKERPSLMNQVSLQGDIERVQLTLATELEFWVSSPYVSRDDESLFISQKLKEQYWKRSVGALRHAMEETLLMLQRYGMKPEMGHKEVGGVGSKLEGSGAFSHMEQIEIDWKYADAMQAIDNEMIAKDIIYDVFSRHGLDVTFKAKPIEGVAGSGEHHHISISLIDTAGKAHNLFSLKDPTAGYLNSLGFGALMGILKHYHLINPFITNSNDALNRLKPGFEAPVNVVCALGHTVSEPSRNRTVLIGLIRDKDNPMATRFELRSPYAGSNSYLLSAAMVACMLDGIDYAKEKTPDELLQELSKAKGEPADYLEASREYRSEVDVFSTYEEAERNERFGIPPKTVYEVITQFYSDEREILTKTGIFTEQILDSFLTSIRRTWIRELGGRVIPDYIQTLRNFKILHLHEPRATIDEARWSKIYQEIIHLMKDTEEEKSLITRIVEATEAKEHAQVSELQFELAEHVGELKKQYSNYKKNIIHLE